MKKIAIELRDSDFFRKYDLSVAVFTGLAGEFMSRESAGLGWAWADGPWNNLVPMDIENLTDISIHPTLSLRKVSGNTTIHDAIDFLDSALGAEKRQNLETSQAYIFRRASLIVMGVSMAAGSCFAHLYLDPALSAHDQLDEIRRIDQDFGDYFIRTF